ncbi:signal peptidase I [Actinomycetes bacterium M1A6_2h]
MTHAAKTPTAESDGRERTGPLYWVLQVVSWALLMFTVAILLAAVVVPKLSDAQPYTILTQSMEPQYPPGTLVVVKKRDPSQLAIGTVITYQIHSGQPDVVTHRIISSSFDSDGAKVFTTQGDNNNAPDDGTVEPGQIRGSLWYSIPYLGYVNNWLTGDTRTMVVSIAAGALLLYAVWQFVSAGTSRRRERISRS